MNTAIGRLIMLLALSAVASLPTPSLASQSLDLPPDATACGENLGCLIQAVEAGNPASATFTVPVDFFGMTMKATALLTTEGREGDLVLFTDKTIAVEVGISDEVRAGARAQGISEEEIDAQVAQINQNAQSGVGTGQSCKFAPDDLKGMLERWRSGSFSTEDWSNAQCTPLQPEPPAQQ